MTNDVHFVSFHEYLCKYFKISIDFHLFECIITLIAMKKSSNTVLFKPATCDLVKDKLKKV